MSDNPYQQPSYDQPVFGQSVMPQPTAPKPPTKKGWSVAFWVMLVLGSVFILGCGCCGGLFYWGMGFLANSVTESYKENAILVEKIGEIKSVSFNFAATGENEGELVFDIKGSKQNGQLFVREQQGQSFGAARLVINGEEFELGPSKPIDEPDGLEQQDQEAEPKETDQQTDQTKDEKEKKPNWVMIRLVPLLVDSKGGQEKMAWLPFLGILATMTPPKEITISPRKIPLSNQRFG